MLEPLADVPRLIVDAQLAPIAGTIFQPTGFPDLGAATFRRPGEPESLLVESVQSMTNHLEALGWDRDGHRPLAPLAELPYVEVVDPDGAFLTSSRLEPHRLAAAYVRDGAIDGRRGAEWIAAQLGTTPGRPLDWSAIYRAVYELDPLCLVHGVFFSDRRWHGTPRVRRALTAAIEAHDVAPAISGGLKRDDVQIRRGGAGMGAEEGYGFVPFGRTEYVAREIVLSAVVDLEQIRGYGLGDEAAELLTLLALWELSTLLAGTLRLRTACDLETTGVAVRRPDGFALPAPDALASAIEQRASGAFEQAGARRVVWQPRKAKAA
jgi:CRISPR-associated protein Csb1